MQEFVSEDDLNTFEGWLRYQGIDATATAPDDLERSRGLFDELRKQSLASPKVGLMKLLVPGEHRYAVAVRDGSDLWLTLWVRRSHKGVFVTMPRADRNPDIRNPHISYHDDGRLHWKSGRKVVLREKRQPLSDSFRGTEHLAQLMGHARKVSGEFATQRLFPELSKSRPGCWDRATARSSLNS